MRMCVGIVVFVLVCFSLWILTNYDSVSTIFRFETIFNTQYTLMNPNTRKYTHTHTDTQIAFIQRYWLEWLFLLCNRKHNRENANFSAYLPKKRYANKWIYTKPVCVCMCVCVQKRKKKKWKLKAAKIASNCLLALLWEYAIFVWTTNAK